MSIPALTLNNQDILNELMELQYMSESELEALISHQYPSENNEEVDADSFIREINTVIKRYRMEITKIRDEMDGSKYYVIVNLADNERSRKSSLIPEHHLEFFYQILTAIMTSPEKSIPVTDALNLAVENRTSVTGKKMAKIGIGQAEELTKKWITDHLLDRSQDDDRLVLGFVAMAEFGHFIKDHYPDSHVLCPSCKLLCLTGIKCTRCSGKYHAHCSGCPVPDQQSSFICPSCN